MLQRSPADLRFEHYLQSQNATRDIEIMSRLLWYKQNRKISNGRHICIFLQYALSHQVRTQYNNSFPGLCL